jgi:hypothetical protein
MDCSRQPSALMPSSSSMRMKQIYPCETRPSRILPEGTPSPRALSEQDNWGLRGSRASQWLTCRYPCLSGRCSRSRTTKLPRGRLSPERLPMDTDDMVQLWDGHADDRSIIRDQFHRGSGTDADRIRHKPPPIRCSSTTIPIIV